MGQVLGGGGQASSIFNGGLLRGPLRRRRQFLSGLTAAYVEGGGANIDTNGQNITISQPLLDGGGGGGLTKYGEGTLFLTTSNTYAGGATIAGGI